MRLPPSEGVGSAAAARFPLQLVANQPATRLHSQLDFGATSQAAKVSDREPVRIHPRDAAAQHPRCDIVRLTRSRACLAGAVLSEALRPGVVQLATGAWYDPDDPGWGCSACTAIRMCSPATSVPPALRRAVPASLGLVEIERHDCPPPPVKPSIRRRVQRNRPHPTLLP
jgi:biotin/methionine sulfoxide reductase